MMISKYTQKLGRTVGFGLLVLLVNACTDNGSTVHVDPTSEATIKLQPPSFLQTRAIDPDILDVEVLINNIEVPTRQEGTAWVGSTTAPKNSSIELNVSWTATLPDGTVLLLATAFSEQTNITSAVRFSVVEESYISTGEGFDADGDGISNLDELKQDLDPLNQEVDPNDVPADVQIFSTDRTTLIDGRKGRDDEFWDFAMHEDVNGEKLYVNNMIREDRVVQLDNPNPDFQWAGIHDGTHLTLFVWGKRANGSAVSITGDSQVRRFHDDDSLEIFIDGNYSQLATGYDKVDDLLINIPLARGVPPNLMENNSNADDKRIFRGGSVQKEVIFDVQDPALVEFGTCFCTNAGRVTWEVRIDMKAANIRVGKTFGLEIQINRDDDGGERDSKWAWAKPARLPNQTNNDADSTWRYATGMGKVKLIPAGQ